MARTCFHVPVCGDGCCTKSIWEDYFYLANEEVEAVCSESTFLVSGVVSIEGLKLNEDYAVTELP